MYITWEFMYILFFKFTFNWSTISLQCVGFCCTMMWISHKYTYTLSLLSPPPCTPSHFSRWSHSTGWASCVIQLLHTQFSSVAQSCQTPCDPKIAARQASLSITNSRRLLKLMSIELVMLSSHLILSHPLLLLPLIPPHIRVFSNESTLCMRWPKYLEFQLAIC